MERIKVQHTIQAVLEVQKVDQREVIRIKVKQMGNLNLPIKVLQVQQEIQSRKQRVRQALNRNRVELIQPVRLQ